MNHKDKLSRQAISFLKHYMIKRGEMLHELPEYCTEIFDEMLRNYPHLNGYIKSYYNEAKENAWVEFINKRSKQK